MTIYRCTGCKHIVSVPDHYPDIETVLEDTRIGVTRWVPRREDHLLLPTEHWKDEQRCGEMEQVS